MAINKNKVMDAARKYVAKGQVARAIKEYLKVVQQDPNEVRVWLKIGDLYTKQGSKQEATETYFKVAEFYATQGFFLKAIAVYKQILKIDPRLVQVNKQLAALYRQLGLLSDAVQQYEIVAAFYHREGKSREALDTIKELVDLDPDNIATRIKLAELYSKESMTAEAVVEFQRAADYLRTHNRMNDFLKVAERLSWHQPEAHELSKELAGLYLKRKDPRRALRKLQACFKAMPKDVVTLELLAQTFQLLDQNHKTVSVLRELVRIHNEAGKKSAADDVCRRILAIAPDDSESLAALGISQPVPAVHQRLETGPVHVDEPIAPARIAEPIPAAANEIAPISVPAPRVPNTTGSLPLMQEPFSGAADIVDDVAEMIEEATDSVAEPRPTLHAEANADAIAKIFTETDVYTKYGLHQKAVEHIRRIFDFDQNNIEAHDKLKDMYESLGRPDEVANQLVILIRLIAPSAPGRASSYATQLFAINPSHSEGRQLVADLGLEVAAPARLPLGGGDALAGLDALDMVDDMATTAAETDVDDEYLIEDEGFDVEFAHDEFAAALESVPERAVEVAPEPITQIVDDSQLEDEVAIEEDGDDAVEFGDSMDLNTDHGDVEDDFAPGPMVPRELPVDLATAPVAVAPKVAVEPEPADVPEDMEDDLDEADFFVAQDLLDSARDILNDLLERYPNHPVVVAKLQDLDVMGEVEGDVQPEPDAGAVPEPVEASPSRAVLATPLDEADAETHFDLGLAYNEMGLWEEAIKEFSLVMVAPGRAVQCLKMIGHCHMSRGAPSEGIEQFKKGLYIDSITDRETLDLYFEIGAAYESLGDQKESLYYYEKVAKRDDSFRKVKERIADLRANKGQKNGTRPSGDDDELDTAFDAAIDGDDLPTS